MIYLPIDIKEKWLKIDRGISELKKTCRQNIFINTYSIRIR